MWKVFLAFVTHRALLLMVALLTLQSAQRGPGRGSVWDKFYDRVSRGPEAGLVARFSHQSFGEVLQQTRNPFHWVCALAAKWTGFHPTTLLLFFSNLMLLAFLAELFGLFNRMVTTDISTLGTTFLILWPTSYELSLGSSLTLAGYLLTLALRHALEQTWWMAGIAAAALALMDPIAVALLPVFAYLFWGVQRFLPSAQWGRNLGFFLGPLFVGALLSGMGFGPLLRTFEESALLDLFSGQTGNHGLFAREVAGQTVTLIFFFLGALGALFSNVNPMHRFLPMGVLLAWVLSSPYTNLATRAPLAAVCFEGIASASTGMASRVVSGMLILLGAYEIYVLFSM